MVVCRAPIIFSVKLHWRHLYCEKLYKNLFGSKCKIHNYFKCNMVQTWTFSNALSGNACWIYHFIAKHEETFTDQARQTALIPRYGESYKTSDMFFLFRNIYAIHCISLCILLWNHQVAKWLCLSFITFHHFYILYIPFRLIFQKDHVMHECVCSVSVQSMMVLLSTACFWPSPHNLSKQNKPALLH